MLVGLHVTVHKEWVHTARPIYVNVQRRVLFDAVVELGLVTVLGDIDWLAGTDERSDANCALVGDVLFKCHADDWELGLVHQLARVTAFSGAIALTAVLAGGHSSACTLLVLVCAPVLVTYAIRVVPGSSREQSEAADTVKFDRLVTEASVFEQGSQIFWVWLIVYADRGVGCCLWQIHREGTYWHHLGDGYALNFVALYLKGFSWSVKIRIDEIIFAVDKVWNFLAIFGKSCASEAVTVVAVLALTLVLPISVDAVGVLIAVVAGRVFTLIHIYTLHSVSFVAVLTHTGVVLVTSAVPVTVVVAPTLQDTGEPITHVVVLSITGAGEATGEVSAQGVRVTLRAGAVHDVCAVEAVSLKSWVTDTAEGLLVAVTVLRAGEVVSARLVAENASCAVGIAVSL